MSDTHAELGDRFKTLAVSRRLVDFVCSAQFETLSEEAVDKAKIFLMDTLAVAVAGRCSPGSDMMLKAAASWGGGDQARVIGRPGLRMSAPMAAFQNGYNAHCLEWDGLHEESVVIAMCVPVAALCAEAEQKPVSGKTLLTALAIAVEVGVILGKASQTAPRFFRPAVSGLMGAAMGIAHMRGYTREQTLQALGIAYSQASGTMQAHWEGAMMVAAQVGVGARAAIYAADMAAAGVQAPQDVLLGQFGFFTLFETADDIDAELGALGRPWKITELAHKPWPAGRATQSILTMFERLRADHAFETNDIDQIIVDVPPLIMLLVGRPLTETMTAPYARLCLKVIGPMMLLDGEIDPRKVPDNAAPSDAVRALGDKFDIRLNDITDPNAMGPQTCKIVLKSGETLEAHCADPYGAITNPMRKDARDAKVRRCFEVSGVNGLDPDRLMDAIETVTDMADVRDLLSTVCKTDQS